MPPVETQNKAKKKSTLPAKVSKYKKLKKNELTTPKSQKLKRDYNEKKKKKMELEFIKQKKKKKVESEETKQKKKKKVESEVKKQKKKKKVESEVKKQKNKKKSESEVTKQKKKKKSESEVTKQKKKKKSESEVKKQKKKKIIVKVPSKSVKAVKPKQKKVVNKKNQKSPTKSLAKKQKRKSPDLKGKITISKRKRQNSASEVQVEIEKKRKILSPFNSSQITKPKEPVEMKKMPQTDTEEVSLRMDEMGTTNQKFVTCFSCNLLVPEKDFHSHLFFGNIKCRFCSYPVQKCTDFANQMLKPNSYCPKSPMKMHGMLQWNSCLRYVSLSVEREIIIKNFSNKIMTKPSEFEICCEISKYTNSLESLEQVEPWKSAFLELKAHCEQVLCKSKPKNCYFLKLFKGNERKSVGKFIDKSKLCSENKLIIRTKALDKHISVGASEDLVVPERKVFSQQNEGTECAIVSELHSSYVCVNITGTSDSNKTESNEMNIKQEEDLIKRRKHHQKLKKRDLKKIVRLPKDGRYLLVNYPHEQCPEECPECYSGFYPSNVTLYCTTVITKVVCEVCGLVIFIVPDFYEDARC